MADRRKYDARPSRRPVKNPRDIEQESNVQESESSNGFEVETSELETPLAKPTIEREYATSKVDASLSNMEIPEANFQRQFNIPDAEELSRQYGSNGTGAETDTVGADGSDRQPHKTPTGNPDLNEMDDADKREGAKLAADALMDTYKQLHHYAREYAKISPQKLNQMYAKGELHPQIVLGDNITLAELTEEYNESCDTALEFDEEWAKKVKKPLVRIFVKRGIGMSDENYVMMEFGKDIVTKGAMLYGMKKSINDTLKTISTQYVASLNPPKEEPSKQQPQQQAAQQPAQQTKSQSRSDYPLDSEPEEGAYIEHEMVD